MPQSIIIVPYNPEWPKRFEHEKIVLTEIIGERLVAIEHIGSTSIPAMGAKAIIDIMVAVPSLHTARQCIADLATIGYVYRPDLRHFLPSRLFFEKGPQEARHFHLHLIEEHSDFWDNHLLFRDYLRRHHTAARAYERLKEQLARDLGTDRHAYSTAKSEFIEHIVSLAQAERDRQ